MIAMRCVEKRLHRTKKVQSPHQILRYMETTSRQTNNEIASEAVSQPKANKLKSTQSKSTKASTKAKNLGRQKLIQKK
jgi:hypothetical protein